jgi:D-alanyl-D-alanine carboxypeptidase
MVRSAYRSSTDQQALRSGAINSSDAGYIAEPGQSEHQAGLAVDFNSSPITCQTCSLDTVSAAWLAMHAPEYGFILRYPSDKVAITGYPAESWHYRYVGKDLALAMQKANLAYEEVYPLFATAQPRGTK